MTTSLTLSALKWLCATALFLFVGTALYVVQADPESPVRRYHSLYVAYLDRKLRNMLLPARGQVIFVAQLLGLGVAVLLWILLERPWALLALPPILLGPAVQIEVMRRERVAKIDRSVDSFMLALASALRTTPSIGNALGYSQTMLAGPIKEELGLALQELRVGNSVDQALLNIGGRLQSVPLDTALATLLIGRQVGGDLTKVLETTAQTLRELARLQGVLRAKTAESKAQMVAMAALPILIVFGFEWMSPGYFQSLQSSLVGWVLMTVAAVLWATSLAIAQQVLAVEL